MNKRETLEAIQAILKANKVKENSELYKELTIMFTAKTRSVEKKSPIYEDDGKTIKQLYCDYLEEYFDVSEFTLSKGHKYGYSYNSKQAKLEMKKFNDKIKSLTNEVASKVNELLDGKITTDELSEIKKTNDSLVADYKIARDKKMLFADAEKEIEA
jgi:hypothetical protein